MSATPAATKHAAAQTAHSFPLDGREVSIGRGSGCDLCVSGLGVSRKHAVIICGDTPKLIDQNSTCGTKLDGEPVSEAILLTGSAITVGMHVIQVYIEDGYISLTLINPGSDAAGASGAEGKRTIRIGRDAGNDICLPHPMVSRFHAVVKHVADCPVIMDLGSANSTYVNGKSVGTAALNEGDVVHIGPFRFFVAGGTFRRVDDAGGADKINEIRIEAQALGVCVSGKKLLEDVDLTIEPGAFVALLGASGAGKSTLSKVLSGQILPTSGRLYMNGFPAAKFNAAFARRIGYVSQQILLRPELTVWETLTDQCLIRLPPDSTEKDRLIRAEEVLDLMGLSKQRGARVSNLSGGEARRLHVGVELLASPAVLILDEPLAGLDPGLTIKFMKLFRRVCDKGHTLILITHTLEQISLCDRLIYIQSGRVLFSGAPSEICSRFNVPTIAEVYDPDGVCGGIAGTKRINTTTVISTSSASGTKRRKNGTSASAPPPVTRQTKMYAVPRGGGWPRHPLRAVLFFLRQSLALTARYSKVYVRDRRNMLLLMAQTPIITLLLGLVYKPSVLLFPIHFYFCLTITGIWVGGLDAVREVAAELPLLARETKCGMKRSSYITARIAVAAMLSAVQAVLFTVSVVAVFKNQHFSYELLLLLFAAIVSGNILGLAVSACSGGVGRAISTLPIVLIPQIFFSGILVLFEHMAELGRQISYLTVSRPIFSIMKKVFSLDQPIFRQSDWIELFLLCAGLIIIFWIALWRRTGRLGNA